MDVIALHQGGFKHAVAPLGTAVTSGHLQQLWRLASEPLMCLDGDSAGLRAMLRVAELALPVLTPGKSLSFVLLPQGEDPDSLINRYGPAKLQEVLDRPWPLSKVIWESYAVGNLTTPEKKAAVEKTLETLANSIADPGVKNHYRAFFREQLWQKKNTAPAQRSELARGLASFAHDRVAIERCEQQAVKLLLLYPELLHFGDVEEDFARMEMHSEPMEQLRAALLDAAHTYEELYAAQLTPMIENAGLSSTAAGLRDGETDGLPKQLHALIESKDTPRIKATWRQIMGGYTLARLEAEYQQAVADMAATMTDESVQRCAELQRELEQNRRARSAGFYEEAAE